MGEASKEARRLVCRVAGQVQGVGFRWTVRELARRHGLRGYARNLSDGRVEVVAEGSPDALEKLRAFCYRGPDESTVTRVESEEHPATGTFHEFTVQD